LKRPNYNAAKRARELKQQAKRDAKLARKRSRKGILVPQPEGTPESNAVQFPLPHEQDSKLTRQGT